MSDSRENPRSPPETAPCALAETQTRVARTDREHLDAASREFEEMCMKLEQAHQEWETALDVVHDAVFLHDREFRILRCNRAYQRHAGIPFHEIIGQPYYAIFPKSDAPLPSCLRKVASKEIEEMEEDVKSGDATFRSRSFTIRDPQGEYLYSVHILEDITEQLRVEKALQQSEERLRVAMNTVRDAIIMIEADHGTITECNPEAEAMFGYGKEEMTGRVLHELVAPRRFSEAAFQGMVKFAITGKGVAIDKTLELVEKKKRRDTHTHTHKKNPPPPPPPRWVQFPIDVVYG